MVVILVMFIGMFEWFELVVVIVLSVRVWMVVVFI